MSIQLVIAEKPSVARSIAGVIGADQKRDGYMEGNGYLVSWCIGHLVSLADAGAYDERFKKWRYDDLPILPQEWQYIIPAEKKGQFAVLRSLMEHPDVTGLVCATDAGREGELIFRFVYQMAGCKKPFKRLWISSMEDAAIREGFAHLKPGADYDDLYQSALCRAQADWLVGINATRLFSILYHKTLTVGRVQTPTLNMMVDREAKISNFKKEKYHVVHIAAGGMEAASDRFLNPDDADATKTACAGAQAVCVSVKREKKTEQPPRLYDLTTLQREANRLFGFTAKQTLDYTLLNVEFNEGADEKTGGYIGWYYVTLAVDGKICTHLETGLNHDIASGKVSDTPTRADYYPAGALKEADVDYVFNNVGFSSASTLYTVPLRDDVRERAEKTLAERSAAAPEASREWGFYIIPDLKTWATNAEQQTPIEHFATFEEAKARFDELRSQPYNSEAKDLNTDGRPYAHLTLGMESKDGMSAADILHVRAGQNYLVEDFTRMERLRSDPVVLESLSRVAQEIGFDRVRPYVVESGSYKAMPDMPFTQWENPHFTVDPPEQGDTFTIYQLKGGPETRDYRFEAYESLQEAGLAVDRQNYDLIYTAPLDGKTTLEDIYRTFNLDRPADFTGHSLSVSDVVVLNRSGKEEAHYCDSFGFTPVPEFFLQREKQLTPRELLTGESIQTPRGSFLVTDMSREQLEAAGYGFHHQSEDGKYLIMGNGTDAFAIPAQQESPIKAAEMTTEQNYNMIDGVLNNAPTMSELEAKAKAGEQISLFDVAEAAKAEAQKPKQPQRPAQKQKKPSIRAQLKAAKEEQQKKPPQREKAQELEV